MKENIDFSICDFIEENMWFFTYYDFCDNRKCIKHLFDGLNKQQKIFYKWYVYANIHMNETYKNAIWDYLVGYDENGFELLRMRRLYKAR